MILPISGGRQPVHHPSAETLLRYAATELGAGAHRLVDCHLECCAACAAAIAARRGDGPVAFDRARARGPSRPGRRAVAGDGAQSGWGRQLPLALRDLAQGAWWWAGPGARSASLPGAAGLGERAYLLKAKAGARLARHGHPGSEWVIVISGSYRDGDEIFDVGDVSEHHESHVHGLVVSEHGPCVCMVVADHRVGLFGLSRWLRPVLKI